MVHHGLTVVFLVGKGVPRTGKHEPLEQVNEVYLNSDDIA